MPPKTVTRRGQSKPPSGLKVLIDMANMPERLPETGELYANTGINLRLSKFLKSLNKEQREYLGSPTDREEFRDRYDAFRSAQEVLPMLAKSKISQRGDFDLDAGVMRLPPISVNLYATQGGLLASSGTFINSLEGVPSNRIRSCAVCKLVFWAPRENSECCSEKCRKTFNKRNSRSARKRLQQKKSSK